MTHVRPERPPRMRHREPDWTAVRDATVGHLQRLLRIDTVNPPGRELEAVRYLDEVLAAEGIERRVHESAPGRANLVARLRGTGRERPVLLLAHTDVVGVEREHWTTEPFGGEIRDGYVYGRGAIDDKGMLAVNLVATCLLKRHVQEAGGTLARDVVLLATADEELGSEAGLAWLARHHPEVLDAEFALNEGGRVRIVDGRPLYAAIQTAEKVSHMVRVVANGPPGHASVPRPDGAILRLGRALAALGAYREPLRLTATTRRFFAELSRCWPDASQAAAMREIVSDDPAAVARGEAVLARVPSLDAVLRNGISATMLAAGVAPNVIPGEADATLNVRTLPGEPVEGVLERLRAAIADPAVTVELVHEGEDAPASDHESPMFDALADALRARVSDLVVVPYVSTGATDSRFLRRLGVQCYGLLPFPLTPDDESRMHGHDERVAVSGIEFGVRVVYETVRRVVAE